MKINAQGYTCFEIFVQRCLLFLCCKKRADDDATSSHGSQFTVHSSSHMDELHVDVEDRECPICCEQFPYSKFVNMTHCKCSFCETCFIHHFSTVIKEKSIIHVVCPICKKPDLERDGNSEESREFFNLLDTQIHHYLDSATHELFQRKLRDKALMEMPNFSWCSHCPFGILHERDTLEMECPSCNKSTCFNCKEQWDDLHELLSCEDFKKMKMEYQEEKLDDYLAENGIECPSCRYRFDLWKGGCLHFKCTQCQHDFCGGCRKAFYQGSECGFSDDCHGKGLHAHHTRDCFYHLRDWEVDRLQKLLQHNGIQYSDLKKELPGLNERSSIIWIPTVKTHMDKAEKKDENTSNDTEEKEHFVKLINANNLDPVDLYTETEMKIELQRWNITIPENCGRDRPDAYLQKLQMKIRQEIPLLLK